MNEAEFWVLIDKSRKGAKGKLRQHQVLEKLLVKLPANEIIAFAVHWYTNRERAYRWDLWAMAYIIGGGCADDGFMDFRAWLVAQGKKIFEKVLKDPETLGRMTQDVQSYELMNYTCNIAYHKVARTELPDLKEHGLQDLPKKPAGKAWREEELPKLYPKMCRQFGLA